MVLGKNTTNLVLDETSLVEDILNDLAHTAMPVTSKKDVVIVAESVDVPIPASLESVRASQNLFRTYTQDLDERTIVGIDALEAYITWTDQALQLLKTAGELTREDVYLHLPKRVQEKERANRKPGEIRIDLDKITERMDRIEQKIRSLKDDRPEYVEERLVLEQKKVSIQAEALHTPLLQTTVEEIVVVKPEEPILSKEVADLLNKKTFDHLAPVIPPHKEEAIRLKRAEEAHKLAEEKQDVIDTPVISAETPQKQTDPLEKAVQLRKMFIETLLSAPKTAWYESPSQNRDHVNEQVMKLAELLSGKTLKELDMNDIQTARIFLFNGAPDDVLTHPAYAYVESFYNYQTKQGYSGKDLQPPSIIASPYATPPESIATNAVKSPLTEDLSQTTRIVPSPFINLSNTKKKDGENSGEFTI